MGKNLINSDSQAIIGDFVRLTYTRNTGVAFGLLADRGLPLSWLSIVALVVVVWLAIRPSARAWPRPVSLRSVFVMPCRRPSAFQSVWPWRAR